MIRKRLLILVLILYIAPITGGCVSQNKFDQVTSELDLAQGQIQELTQANDTLKKDYASLKSKHDTLKTINVALIVEHETLKSDFAGTKADLEKTQTTLENTKTDLADALSDGSALEEKIGKAKTKIKLLSRMFLPIFTGEADQYTDAEAVGLFLEWSNLVEEINDPTLQDKFDTLMSDDSVEKDLDDFFIYLIESISKSLE